MKIWVDDMRPAPDGYLWCKSVKDTIDTFFALSSSCEGGNEWNRVTLVDLDHDAGIYAKDGGDYIKFLDWLEANQDTFREYIPSFRIHSMNSVGVQNMRAIIQKNGWTEVR